MTSVALDLIGALDALVELAIPRQCAGCALPRTSLCDRCLRTLGGHLRDGPEQVWPTPCPPGFPDTWALTGYDGVAAALIGAHKDGGRHDLGRVLARLLREPLTAALATGPDAVVVPAPSSAATTRTRGWSPTRRIATLAAAGDPAPVIPALRMVRRVRDQAGLGQAERALNLRGSIEVRRRDTAQVSGRAVVLVDDVVTTGSTLVECRRALLDAGAASVSAAVIAATRRRGDA